MNDVDNGVQLRMHEPRAITTPKKGGTRVRVSMPRLYGDTRLRILSTATVYLELADCLDGTPCGEAYETIMPAGTPVFRVVRRGEIAVSTDKGNQRVELTAEPYNGRE